MITKESTTIVTIIGDNRDLISRDLYCAFKNSYGIDSFTLMGTSGNDICIKKISRHLLRNVRHFVLGYLYKNNGGSFIFPETLDVWD